MLKKFFAVLVLVLAMAGGVFAAASYDDALKAYQKGDYKHTVAILEEYVKKNPTAEAYYILGYSNYKLRNFKAAERYFNEAYLIDPEYKPQVITGEEKK